jgi:hypothetical protein
MHFLKKRIIDVNLSDFFRCFFGGWCENGEKKKWQLHNGWVAVASTVAVAVAVARYGYSGSGSG